MRHLSLLATLLPLSCSFSSGKAQGIQPADPMQVRQAFDAYVAHPPTVASIANGRRLAYELHLTSFSRVPLELSSVTVADDVTGRVLARLEGQALLAAIGGPGVENDDSGRTVQTGRRAIIYIDLAIAGATPNRIRHRVEFEIQAAAGPLRAALLGAHTTVARTPPPKLGPPLEDGPWVAVYDPSLQNGHRRYVYAVEGRARIPGRFAIDWMKPVGRAAQTGTAGVAVTGEGASVLAVADATVVAVRDGVAEIARGSPRPPLALADATGNYVALDLGGGRYAFYEHLAPGLSVRSGQRVRRGQVIARLGSTGQASRPHLHFHVADVNAPLAAEGEPYLLTRTRVVGTYESIAAFEGGGAWRPISRGTVEPTLPLPNAVVFFDNGPARRSTRAR